LPAQAGSNGRSVVSAASGSDKSTVAGLAGGIVYLILKKQLPPRQAVGVCVVAVITAIFMGDVVAIRLGLSPSASGFALGLLAIKLCSGLIDGSLLDAGKRWLTNGNGGKK
jgi:hypothetical protein